MSRQLESRFTQCCCAGILLLLALVGASAQQSATQPPQETGHFRQPELVELVNLDKTIKLDIRYATANNFLGRPVYTEARAFLQKPAAQALVREASTSTRRLPWRHTAENSSSSQSPLAAV